MRAGPTHGAGQVPDPNVDELLDKLRRVRFFTKQSVVDYNIKLDSVPLLCDNESVVKITKNLILHSRTKHIDIRHHFLREKKRQWRHCTSKR
jgi:hypothetical protein